jgi:hypothetical protein
MSLFRIALVIFKKLLLSCLSGCLYPPRLRFGSQQNNIAVYPDERNAFYREHEDRAYGVEPFFLSYLALEIPFEIVMGAICTLFLVIPGFPSTPLTNLI